MAITTGLCKSLSNRRRAVYTDRGNSLGYGKNDQVTFANNYIHHTSGRSPKVEFSNHWHAYNNYWYRNSGHAFDVGKDSNVLIEGNVFANVKTPSEKDTGHVFAATNADKSACNSALGRSCLPNTVVNSGNLSSSDSAVLSDWSSGEGKVTVVDASKVASSVVANAGVGKLGGSASAASTVGAVSSASASASPSASPSASASASMVKRFNVPSAPFIPIFSQAGPGASDIPTQPSWSWKTVHSSAKPSPPAMSGSIGQIPWQQKS